MFGTACTLGVVFRSHLPAIYMYISRLCLLTQELEVKLIDLNQAVNEAKSKVRTYCVCTCSAVLFKLSGRTALAERKK